MAAKICVVGSINMDLVAKGARIPKPGETLIGTGFMTTQGGKGANQAVAAARLGADVCMVGRVGGDAFGQQLVENLKKNKVDTRFVLRTTDVASGVALIMVDHAGQNSILVAPGANRMVTTADIQAASASITSADVLLLQLEIPVAAVVEAARIARQHGVKVILNPAPAYPLAPELAGLVDVIIPNEYEAQILTGSQESSGNHMATTEQLQKLGIATVITTLGSEGAILSSAGESKHFPAFRITPVDTTAAGDAFVGSFAVAISRGCSLEEAIVWGNAAGALAATKMGAQLSLPGLAEVTELVNRPRSE